MIAEDRKRYDLYESIRARRNRGGARGESDAVGRFITSWINLERVLRELHPSGTRAVVPSLNQISERGLFDAEMLGEFRYVRNMRNMLVHGSIEIPSSEELISASSLIDFISDHLTRKIGRGSRED